MGTLHQLISYSVVSQEFTHLSCFLFAIAIAVVFIVHYLNLPGGHKPLVHIGDLYQLREHLTFAGDELLHAIFLDDGMIRVNGPLWELIHRGETLHCGDGNISHGFW
jgi:hypothetical protein